MDTQILYKNFKHTLIAFLFICGSIPAFAGGGGGCTFSDNCPGSSFTACSPVTADNTSCSSSAICDPGQTTIAGGFGADECDMAYVGGCGGTYTDPSGECTATITCMGMTASCSSPHSICGTVENTSYSQLCIPASYTTGAAASCTYSFLVTGISCSGGGASLQWGVYPSAASCATLANNYPSGAGMLYCNGSVLANSTVTGSVPATFSPGSCYKIFFDGNAQAACNWTFDIIPPPVVAGFTGLTTVCVGSCITMTSTSECYGSLAWSNTQNPTTGSGTTYSFCPTAAGSFNVNLTASSAIGACTGATYVKSVVLGVTATVCCVPPTITFNSQTNVNCNGAATGAIDISVSGGTSPYTYNWSNGSSVQDPTGLVAGAYTVTVTETGLCTATATYTITQPPALTITPTVTNALCPCENTAGVSIVMGGGTPGYTYAWSSGATTQNISSVAGGVAYTVTVTDSKGCTITATRTPTTPTPITVALVTQVNANCFGECNGSVNVSASGGTSPYDFSNNAGGTYQANNVASYTYTGLCVGPITIAVRDANGCLTPP